MFRFFNCHHKQPNQYQQLPTVDPDHIAPSGTYYPHTRNQSFNANPPPKLIQNYISEIRNAASYWSVANYEIWTKTTLKGVTVTFGNLNLLDHHRMQIQIHGNEDGEFFHTKNFQGSPQENKIVWIAAARQLLNSQKINYTIAETPDHTRFHFTGSVDWATFTVAVDRGVIDQIATGRKIIGSLPKLIS